MSNQLNIFYKELIGTIKSDQPSKDSLLRLKMSLCKKHGITKIPTDVDILLNSGPKDFRVLQRSRLLMTKPNRSLSGVCVIAIMSKPSQCPHANSEKIGGVGRKIGHKIGPCIMCPGGPSSEFGDVPQSYTGREPATMRAKRNNYDPYLQVMNRLEQYVVTGHTPEKIELIIMGGTFPAQNYAYQKKLIAYAFKAMNDFSDRFYKSGNLDISKYKQFFELPGDVGDAPRTKNILNKLKRMMGGAVSLTAEQTRNETAKIRCIGITVETRPDYATAKDARRMLELGVTRVELGVQTTYDSVLKKIRRGHTVQDSINATRTLKDFGFKICYHMMPGLPGVSKKKDTGALKTIFEDQRFRPDMLKIYPCMVMRGTKLYELWKKGKFRPITTSQAAEIIAEFKKTVPKYARIMRVQRDIPTEVTEAGVNMTNLRQYIDNLMRKKKYACKCIRCREIERIDKKRIDKKRIDKKRIDKKRIDKKKKIIPELQCEKYYASEGQEHFISINDKAGGGLIGFCRMRFPSQHLPQLTPEITKGTALIRELHVYGTALRLSSLSSGGKDCQSDCQSSTQHKGYGKTLLATAESIAKKNGKNKIVVISGVGAREYYRKLGYARDGWYMSKSVFSKKNIF